jgi:hypothetical protein
MRLTAVGTHRRRSLDDAIEQQGRADLAERLAGWYGKYPDVRVRRAVVRDAPAQKRRRADGRPTNIAPLA